MSVFESTVKINKPVSEVYKFLADMNNHKNLMPDNIINWTSTADVANFEIENITKLALNIAERITNMLIRIIPAKKPPFDMELNWKLIENKNGTQAVFTIIADLNMMMKLVASAPLKKLVEEETKRLAQILN